MSGLTVKDIARAVALAMEEKKADDVQILGVQNLTADCDYFVIGSCQSITQIGAVAQSVAGRMDELGIAIRQQEGRNDNKWVLMDYYSVIIHIFLDEEREYYSLEKLWAAAEKIDL